MLEPFTVILGAIGGAVTASLLTCLPGFHVYTALGLSALSLRALQPSGTGLPPVLWIPFLAGLVVGYALLNTLPAVLLGAPDESALYTLPPGQAALQRGRGYEAVLFATLGGMAGLLLLVLIVGPLAPRVLPPVQTVLAPHVQWIVWCLIAFILLSERPGRPAPDRRGWRVLADTWRVPAAGLATFLLAGLLGFILLLQPPLTARPGFDQWMPAFVGLFTLPPLLVHIACGSRIPRQVGRHDAHGRPRANPTVGSVLHAAVAGALGGGFAAALPGVMGGVGGFLTDRITAPAGRRTALMAQGASKLTYYAGGVLLLFVPGMEDPLASWAFLPATLRGAGTSHEYCMLLGSLALGGAAACLLVSPLARLFLFLIQRAGYRSLCVLAACSIVGIVGGATGWTGLLCMLSATGIGLIPVLSGANRINGMAVILLPWACLLSGHGVWIARWMGVR